MASDRGRWRCRAAGALLALTWVALAVRLALQQGGECLVGCPKRGGAATISRVSPPASRRGGLDVAAYDAGGLLAVPRRSPGSPEAPARAVAALDASSRAGELAAPAALERPNILGAGGLEWLPMGLELEMQPKAGGRAANFSAATRLAREALAVQRCPRKLGGCPPAREAELRLLAFSLPGEIKKIAKGHWTILVETDPGPLYELVSPWLWSEAEASLAVGAGLRLDDDFGGGDFASLHLHVDGRCLLRGGGARRVAMLLLLWESFHMALVQLLARRTSATTYGQSLRTKHPALLSGIQEFWIRGGVDGDDSVLAMTALFKRHHDGLFVDGASGLLSSQRDSDGYRNLAVNICHLLDIKCCRDCSKNSAPKHGLVEFRIFDVAYGTKLRLLMQLVQRLVQHLCADDAAAAPLILLPGREQHANASALLTLLGMTDTDFFEHFPPPPAKAHGLQAGTERKRPR